MSAIITLTTDFGMLDYYVAAVKGSILRQTTDVVFVDVSHQIRSSDIAQAAYTLKAVYEDFPDKSIHLVAVDTHTDNDSHLLVYTKKQYFIIPDNGIIGLLFPDNSVEVYQLTLTDNYLSTFPSKSLYAEIAGEIAQGTELHELGTLSNTYKKKMYSEILTDEETIRGHVIHVDGYGNLITNVDKDLIEAWSEGEKVEIQFGHEKIYRIAKNFTECDFGDCIVLYTHANQLMIGIRQGNASQLLGMRYDSSVIIKKVK